MKRTIRWIATVLHIGVIVVAIVFIVDKGYTSYGGYRPDRILAGFGFILGATLTLRAIWGAPGRTLLGLYFERKRLEERVKMKRLESDGI